MTTVALAYRSIQSRVKLSALPQVNWKLLCMVCVAACFLLSVFYVFYVNQLTQGAYLIKNYGKELDALSKETKMMRTELAESGFLDQMHKRVELLGFEKISQIKYIEMEDTSLAKAK